MEMLINWHSILPWLVLHSPLGAKTIRQVLSEETIRGRHDCLTCVSDSNGVDKQSQCNVTRVIRARYVELLPHKCWLHLHDGTHAQEMVDFNRYTLECY